MKREKKALGYAVTELKGEELNTNLVNPVSALQGKVAGVNINQSDGGLFGSNKIEIRGASTLGKNNQPIYVVDGIILDNAQNDKEGDWDANNSDYGNELKNLNPADFESVSVLKGAAATALYGSRGLNGVVVITTKSGKGSKGYGVTFTQTIGCDWKINSPKFQNIYGEGTFNGWATSNPNVIPGLYDNQGKPQNDIWDNTVWNVREDGMRYLDDMYSAMGWGAPYDGQPVVYFDGTIRPYKAYKNNYKDAYRTGFNTTTNVAITGGNETTNFYLSAGYKYAQGVVENNDMKRYNMLLKASHQISRTVNIEGGVNFGSTTPRNSPINIGEQFVNGEFGRSYDSADRFHYKGEHGGVASSAYGDKYGSLLGNGFWWGIFENNYKQKEVVVRPNIKLTVKPLEWMTLSTEGSFNYYYVRGETKNPGSGYRNEGGSYALSQTTKEQTNLNVNMNLNKEWGDFETHGLIRGEYYHSYAQSMSVRTDGGLVVPNKFFISNSKNPVVSSGSITGTKTMWSAMAQLGASWKGQVYLDVTGRNDWSSALLYSDGHGTYSYFYPSVSASWLADNTFREYLPWWVSLAKFRASWAQVGNDTSPYTINNAYSFSTGTVGGNSVSSIGIPTTQNSMNLKPERKTSWEFGLDWRFVNNRFGIDFAYYKENTKDQIMTIAVPSVSGISNQLINAGNIENRGIEIALNATPIELKDWTWDMTFTFTHNKSKIVELHPNVANYILLSGDPAYGNYRIGSVAKVGGAYGTLLSDSAPAYDTDQYNEDGSLKAKGSGLPILAWHAVRKGAFMQRSGELKEVGDINPKFLGSVSTNLRYKNWRLNVSLDGRFGGYVASYGAKYGTGSGLTETSLAYRDAAHGGVTYTSMWNGKTYHDGVIPDGIFPTGTVITLPNHTADQAAPTYTVGTGKYETGETFKELLDKGIIEPTHASLWTGRNMAWVNVASAPEQGVITKDWFRKLNYIALREVSLSYSLPQNIAAKLGSKGINLTATGHNLGYLLNSLPNKENPESVRGTNSSEFRLRTFEGTTASFTFTINAQF